MSDGHSKDGRALRKDDRPRHDGKVSPSLSGPVIQLDPATMMPRRINVTNEDDRARIKEASGLSWEEQAEEQERLASILLAKVSSEIRSGNADDNTINRLSKLTLITSKFLAEQRRSEDEDDGDESIEDLRAKAAELTRASERT